MKTHFFQRALWVGVALTSASSTIVRADVQYTTQTSIAQDGALKPISSVTTWLKTGWQRMDSTQTIGTYHSDETTVSDKAKKQTLTWDPNLKIYAVEPLQQGTTSAATRGGATGGASKTGVGTLIMTVGAQFLGLEKLMERPVRHYKTSVQTDSSGCCGTGKSSIKSEVWMADVQLPVFDAGATGMDWRSAYTSASGNCQIQFQQKGDVKGYEAAQKGLALKTISFDAEGKPVFSSEITSLSMAALTSDKFAVPAGYKKVTRTEYDAARTQAMMSAMMPKEDQGQEDSQ
ncbi:hypothetical protein IAD21_06355 [Abditibacteriota bacterium]|nr:hypothetical protein IAD21_06355 [Abditibacteriota bacterium]